LFTIKTKAHFLTSFFSEIAAYFGRKKNAAAPHAHGKMRETPRTTTFRAKNAPPTATE